MRAAGWVLLLFCVFTLGACSRRERSDDCGEATRVVDPVLLAFLSKARSAHHLADQHEAKGDRASALRAIASDTTSRFRTSKTRFQPGM